MLTKQSNNVEFFKLFLSSNLFFVQCPKVFFVCFPSFVLFFFSWKMFSSGLKKREQNRELPNRPVRPEQERPPSTLQQQQHCHPTPHQVIVNFYFKHFSENRWTHDWLLKVVIILGGTQKISLLKFLKKLLGSRFLHLH